MVNYSLPIHPNAKIGSLMTGGQVAEDFMASSIGTAEIAVWDSGQSTTGTAVASETEPNGAVVLTTGGSNGADVSIQLNGEPIVWSNENGFIFEAKLKLGGTAACTWFCGLAEKDSNPATIVGTGSTVGSVGFKGEDANIDYHSRAVGGTPESQGDTGEDLVAATYVTLSMKWNPLDGKLRFYVDGDQVKSLAVGTDTLPNAGDDFTIMVGGDTTDGTGTTITVASICYLPEA